ncbi:MAG: hypothetical protein Q4B82_07295 [Alysiella sp.]|uniref:hypothetical protein n=1 Tax=Alysiella sp. TaxID=1872483 RepID=UPI0026DAE2B3|nr:hypothetical protein [Alysiella sp.]MDO4434366.1 hypothetical protein [Alysiella sp.]
MKHLNVNPETITNALQDCLNETNKLMNGNNVQAFVQDIQNRMNMGEDVDFATVIAQTVWDWRERN